MPGSGRVAVVGGGLFGVTAAIVLARRGFRVDLFERASDILTGASAANQRRLHRGYHYPRSDATAAQVLAGMPSFLNFYEGAVVRRFDHYVAIARHGSRTVASEYLDFCRRHALPIREEYPPGLRRSAVELSLRVAEESIDIDVLRQICWQRLLASGVVTHLGRPVTPGSLTGYDQEVVATYDGAATVLGDLMPARELLFQVCEKPVVAVPPELRRLSLVILDGRFLCIDPVDDRRSILGNVIHAVHRQNVGHRPDLDPQLAELLRRRYVAPGRLTRYPQFVTSARSFLPAMEAARHLGSMFVVRTVVAHRESTDERPSIVERLNEQTIMVHGGKLGTCVTAAHQAADLVERSFDGAGSQRCPVGADRNSTEQSR